MIMGRLERYIGGRILRATGMTALVLVPMLVFFNFVAQLGQLGKGDFHLLQALVVAVLIAPRYIVEAFPVAALLGSLLGLGGLASHSELVAMRAAGFSVHRIIVAVFKVGLLMMLVAWVIGELVAPPAERFAQQYRYEKQHNQAVLISQHGFWARDGHDFINIRQLGSGVHVEGISIYEFDPQWRMIQAIHAASADYLDGHWTLNDIASSSIGDHGVQTRHLADARWDSLLDPSLLSVVSVQPNMLPVWELSQYIRFLRRNGQSAIEYRVAYWLKIANPIATLVMLLLAVPFVLGDRRGGSMGQRIFLGAVVGAGFFLLNRAVSFAAVVYDFNPLLSAALPALLFAAATVWKLRRVR